MTDISTFYPPIDPPNHGSTEGATAFLSFDECEERLVEAMITCWRHPDRERGWQRIRSAWPDVMAEPGDYDARGGDASSSDVAIRSAAMTRREVAEMEEAFGWTGVLKPRDRKLVGLVVSHLARGRREVSWDAMLQPMGTKRGADGLRMRYSRAITAMCNAKNGRNPRADVSIR